MLTTTPLKDNEQQIEFNKIYEEHEEVHRKQFNKWNKTLEEHNKKTDEIFNKCFKKIEAEESDQNFGNWFLSFQISVFGTTDFCYCPENIYIYEFSGKKSQKTWRRKNL